jgi:hypothetical protein
MEIPFDDQLLRRIRPDQIVDDGNTGKRRPSSAAFKDPKMSVDAESILKSQGLDYRFSLSKHPGYSLARFPAAAARAKNLSVEHQPEPENPAHAVVLGKKTQGIANYLVSVCEWAHLEPAGGKLPSG